METETVQVEIIYDPSTHGEKLTQITEYTQRLKNVRFSQGMLHAVLLSIYPVLRDAESLIEYFETLIKMGSFFGVIINNKTVRELDELRDAVKTIRDAANREFSSHEEWN